MQENITTSYKEIINRIPYDYFFTISFPEETYNGTPLFFNEDEQLKLFIKLLHRKLLSNRYKKYNRYLNLVLVRETHISKNNAHFHGLISTKPHDISFLRLIQAFQYAASKMFVRSKKYNDAKLYSITQITDNNIPDFTYNHSLKKHTVDPEDYPTYDSKLLYEILPKDKANQILALSHDHSFPHNLIPIEPNQQERITDYILKDLWKAPSSIALLEPTISDDYFNFSTI